MLDCAVQRLDWNPANQVWRLETARGERTANHVVIATGALAEPVIPTLPGVDRFAGATFHSARWDHDFDLAGKRVAVIGTGASAVQFIPAIQPTTGHITVFQRTPHWVMPRHDREIGARTQRLLRAVPALQRLQRLKIYLQREWIVIGFHHPWLMTLAERQAAVTSSPKSTIRACAPSYCPIIASVANASSSPTNTCAAWISQTSR
jgi:cation diffusion facilitator CzcD-associated flavoprotein CzcO